MELGSSSVLGGVTDGVLSHSIILLFARSLSSLAVLLCGVVDWLDVFYLPLFSVNRPGP